MMARVYDRHDTGKGAWAGLGGEMRIDVIANEHRLGGTWRGSVIVQRPDRHRGRAVRHCRISPDSYQRTRMVAEQAARPGEFREAEPWMGARGWHVRRKESHG